jgi:hypothetical protein
MSWSERIALVGAFILMVFASLLLAIVVAPLWIWRTLKGAFRRE